MKTPRWDERNCRWILQEQRDGKRYSFTSGVPGAKGRKECQLKYENWYYGDGSGEKTVGQVAKEYLADLKARRGKDSASYEQNECYIRNYLAPRSEFNKKIAKMTLRDWQNIINETSGIRKALSEKSLKNLRAIIMAIIKFGYEDYQCEMPRGKLYIPKGHGKAEKEILQRDDVRRLMEPTNLWYGPLFQFLAITGVRPGEALGLQIGDIDFINGTLTIRRAVNARGHITDGKNENARRMIPIGELAKEILRETIKRNEEHKLHTEWIFCSADGSQGNQTRMRKHWQKLKEERNLPGTVYSLRHTFITLMKNVMPEQMIKDIVGHSVSFDSFGTYGHIYEGESREAAQIIDLTFKNDTSSVALSAALKSTKGGQKNQKMAESL